MKSLKLRPWLRALHRDAGYLAVGLTFVYALSGLAVNHIADWDPNFTQIKETHQLKAPLPTDDQALARKVLHDLGRSDSVEDVYRISDTEVELVAANVTYHVNPKTGRVRAEGQEPRLVLRIANWLHLNRGKQAWTYIADTYAVFLLFLASSGLFMIRGRKGLVGRGAVLTGIGAAVPILYVVLSGGP
jgi:hypothetical protein